MAQNLIPDPQANMSPALLARIAARKAAGVVRVNPATGLVSAQPQRISIEGNRFTMIKASGEAIEVNTLSIQGVVIGFNENASQMYYEEDFRPNQAEYKPPTCYSDNGIGPSTNATNPQSATCDICPRRAWGSAVSKLTNKAKPACQKHRKLAFMWRMDGQIYRLAVTPGSFANWAGLISMLGPDIMLEDFVIEVSFAGTGILAFKPVVETPDAALEVFEKARATQLYRDILGLDDKPIVALTAKQASDLPPTVEPEVHPDLAEKGNIRYFNQEQPAARDPYAAQQGIPAGHAVNPMTGEILPMQKPVEAAPPWPPEQEATAEPAKRGRRPKVEAPAAPAAPPASLDEQLIRAMQGRGQPASGDEGGVF